MGNGTPRLPMADGFDPHKIKDTNGLSVYREKYPSPEQVAGFRTKGTKPSWVVKLRAQSVIDAGLTLIAAPREAADGLPAQQGHALIVEINSAARKSDLVEQWKRQLLASIIGVEGGDNGFAAPVAATDPPSHAE